MTVGKFVLINTYLMQLYQPLGFLGFVYMTIKQGIVDMEQMFRLLRGRTGDHGSAGRAALARICWGRLARCGSKVCISATGRTGRSSRASISSCRPARKLAIVGPTGAGKSTISRLLFRFYDVTQGSILIDGQDIRDVTQDSLRAAIGVVPQDTVLFNDTIRYNIAYGRPGATQDEIEQAARLAQVHDFVTALPDGYDTRVGERGLKLSGGEKQRVAIARTILKDPRILILDEATSALDTGTEQDIQAALRAVARRSHHAGDRPSPVHRGGCRRDHRAARRPRGGARHATRRCWRAMACMHGCGHCRPSRRAEAEQSPIEGGVRMR